MTDQSETEKDVVELEAPDISAYKAGNTGIDYITSFESGKPGPHVMISAVVHGNELCGAIALDHLFRHDVRPAVGKLTLAFMNVAAYHSFDPDNPRVSRYVDEDFNRLWGHDVLEGTRDSVECRRARERAYCKESGLGRKPASPPECRGLRARLLCSSPPECCHEG